MQINVTYRNREDAGRFVYALRNVAEYCSYRDPIDSMRFSRDLVVVTLPRGYTVHDVNEDGSMGGPIETLRWSEEARHAI